jgi:hypothetical protein
MWNITQVSASTLRAILQYIDPVGGPQIAFDDDSLAPALIEKIKAAVGERHGSITVSIGFYEDEAALREQFSGVIKKIHQIFSGLSEMYS